MGTPLAICVFLYFFGLSFFTIMMMIRLHNVASKIPLRALSPVLRGCRFSASTEACDDVVPPSQRLHYDVIPKEDFGIYKEYSVIHTDRSLNLMSDPFQRVMRDLNELMKVTYAADKVAIIPG